MFYQLINIVFVDICEDKITFQDQVKQKTRKIKIVHLLFLATVCVCVYIYIYIYIYFFLLFFYCNMQDFFMHLDSGDFHIL